MSDYGPYLDCDIPQRTSHMFCSGLPLKGISSEPVGWIYGAFHDVAIKTVGFTF